MGDYRSVLFFESGGDTNERAVSFTASSLQSLILINGTIDPGWIFLLDKYVHEAAHTYLFAINLQEEMVLNTEGTVYSSPLRRDARDMLAIYHATFVIQRLILALTRVLEHGMLIETDRLKISGMLNFYHARLGAGFETVMEHGVLSDLARDIIQEGQDVANSLRSSTALKSVAA